MEKERTINRIGNRIIHELRENEPMSINLLAQKSEINWRTAKQYLDNLSNWGLVKFKDKKYFLIENNHFFNIPIPKKTQEKIFSIYYKINESCQKKFNKEPTKTHVYKIIWKLSIILNLKLPIGWYKYGPCCVIPYKGDEKYTNLNKKEELTIKDITEKYCKLDSTALQKKIYTEENNLLYLTKQELISTSFNRDINMILMDLVKYSPDETNELVTDFVRTTMLIGWNETTRNCFDILWNYIATYMFKQTLKNIDSFYFEEKLEQLKKEADAEIDNLLNIYIEPKHSQDKLYQRWVKKKK